ncbi:MAG: hypothetical protein R3B72_50830 [Polyangiaceae bacterium]
MSTLALLEAVHGHFGVLAAAALLHPAILLRKGRPLSRGLRWSIGLTTLTAAIAFTSGLLIYPGYVAQVRPLLFHAAPRFGLLFETKEHLAFLCLATALGAGVTALLAPREAPALRRLAASIYAVSATACIAVVVLGSVIASIQTFAR